MNSIDGTLQVTRLGRLLENARALIGLSDDAHEKKAGEFILDRQYVVSLIDDTVEKLGALVFDATVLLPEAGEDLYAQHDVFRSDAAALQEQTVRGESDPPSDEPFEYWMLDTYLAWMRGTQTDRCVRDFVGHIVDRVFGGLAHPPVSRLPMLQVPGTDDAIGVLDLGGGLDDFEAGTLGSGQVSCRPLRLMLIGGSDEKPSGPAGGAVVWLALASADHLSLRGPVGDPRVFIEATLPAHGGTGVVLVYSRNTDAPHPDIPAGFREEATAAGRVAWRTDELAGEIESALTGLSRSVFA